MRTIYKYTLAAVESQYIDMPAAHEILCVQVQRDIPCLWVAVGIPDDARGEDILMTSVHILTYGTGYEIFPEIEPYYIGTYQIANGAFVYHVFKEMTYDPTSN